MKKVYLIEENDLIADMLVAILEDRYRVSVKKDTKKIAEELSFFQPDLLIIDHYDGAKAVEQLNNCSKLRNIPLILCCTQQKEVKGSATLLSKPFGLTDITRLVESALDE